jgi:hypothetical protein
MPRKPIKIQYFKFKQSLYTTSDPHFAAFSLLAHQKDGPQVHGSLPTVTSSASTVNEKTMMQLLK